MNGLALFGYPEGTPDTWDPCSTGTFAVKSDASTIPTPDFAAFVAYIPVTCSSFTIASDPIGFSEKAEIALEARISFAIEAALARGVPMSANPYLADANVDVLASAAAVSPEVGLAYLENAVGATGQQGMLHATPAVISRWFDKTGYATTDPLTTPNGTVVVSGGGYAGATPFGEADASADQSWVYATGPVQAWVESETRLNLRDVLDRSNNDVTFRAERYALVEWDTSLQAAVLIDWGT